MPQGFSGQRVKSVTASEDVMWVFHRSQLEVLESSRWAPGKRDCMQVAMARNHWAKRRQQGDWILCLGKNAECSSS